MTKGKLVEIRRNPDGTIDEVVARGGSLHIEQLSDDGWYIGLDMPDGTYWQFYLGAKNRKSHVDLTLTESGSIGEKGEEPCSTPSSAP